MYCKTCGTQHHDLARFCQQCGAKFVDHSSTKEQRLVGVRGWLKFLCISFCILTPLYTLAAVWPVWNSLAGRPEPIRTVLLCLTLFGCSGALLSFYAGYLLWRIRPGALGFAKALLTFSLVAILALAFGIWATDGLDDAFKNSLLGFVAQDFMKQLIYSTGWIAYLSWSRRVRATYGASSFSQWWASQADALASPSTWGRMAAIALGLLLLASLVSPEFRNTFLFGRADRPASTAFESAKLTPVEEVVPAIDPAISPAGPHPTTISSGAPTSEQKKAEVAARLERVAAQVVATYPYLNTPEGAQALALIIADRDARIASGWEAGSALLEAANLIAPAHMPPRAKIEKRYLSTDNQNGEN